MSLTALRSIFNIFSLFFPRCGLSALFLVLFAQSFGRKGWAIALLIWPSVFMSLEL